MNLYVLQNLDLLSVGIVVAATTVLGFIIYFSNPKSITNKIFFCFTLVTAVWGTVTYFSYQSTSSLLVLWLFRLTMFFAILQAVLLYLFFKVFPETNFSFSKKTRYIIVPLVILTAIITLTRFLFSGIVGDIRAGEVAVVSKGPGLILFGIVAIGLVLMGIYRLVTKIKKADINQKKSYRIIALGTTITFSLIILFSFVFATVFTDPRFVPLGALFFFPFIAFTSYAILRHHLFSVQAMWAGVLVFLLVITTFFEVVFAGELGLVLYRSAVFLLLLFFGVLLIKGIIRETKQREQLEILSKELAVANERLKELDKLKTEFLSFASHQLRSPLTAIKGYTSMLLEGSYGNLEEKAKEPVGRVMESANHLVKLIEDFLNITKIEQGGMKYVFAKTDIEHLLRELTKELSVAAEKKGLKLTFETDGKVGYYANADQEKLRQVLLNFIDNAIKYTPAGGFVKVVLEKTPASPSASQGGPSRKLRVSVTDSGIGMDAETQAKLFQKFGRGKEGAQTNTGGSGLGLYLAKQIVEAHNGAISASSPGPGQGSTFAVELAIV